MNAANQATILVVEDSKLQQMAHKTTLEGGGYKVLQAMDGESALVLASQVQPDLILLDLGLPKMSGLEVLNELRQGEKTRDITILILSGDGKAANIQEAIILGANGYFNKNMTSPEDILAKIAESLPDRSGSQWSPSNVFRLGLLGDCGDVDKLRQALSLQNGLNCPTCGTALLIEARPDPSQNEVHAMSCRLVCPGCSRTI
ncbi:MAG TPA: hypothetical protein DCZ01_11905 [Elusimicrobia bacterium]|nr:MAG: hypothetical protein A2X37_09035 [Elusimicrobia bacterium GWA2_66_18]OGR71764.1 MAG: hypothetical protein A2X40_05410 [Elusimicrobia bacterium GWC2_65_9]HAZ09194.1 hypothetical protein [Elusimicrobiota bacterium]